MNFKDTKRDEVLGHKATMRAMTTAAIVLCSSLPLLGLRQTMHNPTIELYLSDIVAAPGITGNDNEIGAHITRSLISDAIKKVHSFGVNQIFDHSERTAPTMPEIDRIRTNKTEFWQFGAIFEDEGTIAGTYGVHQSIFLDQLQLSAPDKPTDGLDDDFITRLHLVHGDQLTAQRIRTVKAEQSRAGRPYDRLSSGRRLSLIIVRNIW
jgi:hypothetical protein